jgi:hypothetical protein
VVGGDTGGGSVQLGQLIDDGHGQAIRYDLQRVGLDLADVWRGRLCPRRALDLVEQGPDDSAFHASLRGGLQHRAWPVERHFQAALVDAVNTAAWVVAQTRSKKSIPRPAQVPRPETAKAARTARRRLDLSAHPAARPLPETYRAKALPRGG